MLITNNLPVPFHETFNVHDASKIQDYDTCPRLYFYKYILGYRPIDPIHDLVFGKAFHIAKEILFLEGYSMKSIENGMKAFLIEYRKDFGAETDMDRKKNPASAMLALTKYVQDYERDEFKVLYTEIGITVPVADDRVLYGKMDAIVKDPLFGIQGYDTKTAGAHWSYLEASFRMKMQMALYTHFLFSYFEPEEVYGMVIDATIFTKEPDNLRISIPLNINYLESWLWETNRILDDLEVDFSRLEAVKERNINMRAFRRRTESCVKYNRICEFHDLCYSRPNPVARQNILPAEYRIEFWDCRKEEMKHKFDLTKGEV